MWDRQTIVEKIRDSADKYGDSNPQQMKQLLFGCEKASERELFFGVFSFYYDPELQENSFARQEVAGKILFKLKPACPVELDGFIYAIPKYWNLSIEEVPWYLCKVFGKNEVEAFLKELIPSVNDGELQRSFKTLLFWVKNYNA
ncbi:hypothetical protein [Aurantivibrio infirmus]